MITGPRLLVVSPGLLAASKAKGVLDQICTLHEGFFEHVFQLCFFTPTSQVVPVDGRTTWIEWERNFPCLGKLSAMPDFVRYVLRGVRFVHECGISVIRGTYPYFRGLFALLVGRLAKVPVCISLHADYDQRHRLAGPTVVPALLGWRGPLEALERWVLQSADRVFAIRQSLEAYAVRHGARPERVRPFPHGVEASRFALTPQPEWRRGLVGPHDNLVVFAGRLSRDNYVDDVLAIAARVAGQEPAVRFLLFGDGEERRRLANEITRRGLTDHVRLPGSIARDRLAQIRAAADVNLCLMGGFSLIEAALSGRPVVAYDVEWHRELIRDGETGCLVPEHDVQGAASAVLRLLDVPALADRLGQQARELARARHSLDLTSRIKARWYEELLQARTS